MFDPAHTVLPLTAARIAGQLHELGIRFGRVDENEIIASFTGDSDHRLSIVFCVEGPWLAITSTVGDEFTADQLHAARPLISCWNVDHRFTAGYLATSSDGASEVVTQYQVPVAEGLTDAQLRVHLEVAVSSAGSFWSELRARLVLANTAAAGPSAADLEAWLEHGAA
jgi:hypothetical protein